MNYSSIVRVTRLAHGLTLEELGKKTGHTKQYMYLIETGKIRLSYELAVNIARVFNMTPDSMFLGKSD